MMIPLEDTFENTKEGCDSATDWLQENGHWAKLAKEWSTDGYTIVALANSLRDKEEQEV